VFLCFLDWEDCYWQTVDFNLGFLGRSNLFGQGGF
jgi:hypothetical protein